MQTPKKLSSDENGLMLFHNVLHDRQLIAVRVLFVISLLISLLILINGGFGLSCIISLAQNVVITFAATYYLLSHTTQANRSHRIRVGIIAGSIIGEIPSALYLLVNSVQYYFLGGMEAAFSARGQLVPQMTPTLVWSSVMSQVVLWVLLAFVSAITGLIAGLAAEHGS